MSPAIFQRASDNILLGAAITSTVPPVSTYDLATLGTLNPAARVIWDVKTVTITFTIAAALGDILVIPMHNLDAGSSVLTLTNGAGFSHALTIPASQANGFPPTLVVDLTALSGTRTSTVWNLVISGNSANVVLGGCVAIYGPKRTFAGSAVGDNFTWDFHERETAYLTETANVYGSVFIQDYETVTRQIEVTINAASETGLAAFRDWFRANHGRVGASLFWPDPAVTDAYLGRWQATFDVTHHHPRFKPFTLVFDELSKGKPV